MQYVDFICFLLPYTHASLVHRWLYEHVGILHRDLSLNNIMCRIIKEMNSAGVREVKEVYGVLTDYDLSLWTASLTSDYTKTSQQRAGTPPFMARGLLNGTDSLHLYRHDVESLFYVILILVTRYEIETPEKGEDGGVRMRQGLKMLPYQSWFDQPSYEALAAFKLGAIYNLKLRLDLSPTFEDFGCWLMKLRRSFSLGSLAKLGQLVLEEDQTEESCGEDTPAAFDDETLGGHVNYSALVGPVGNLKGRLEGLVIRYPPPPPTSADATKANA